MFSYLYATIEEHNGHLYESFKFSSVSLGKKNPAPYAVLASSGKQFALLAELQWRSPVHCQRVWDKT